MIYLVGSNFCMCVFVYVRKKDENESNKRERMIPVIL